MTRRFPSRWGTEGYPSPLSFQLLPLFSLTFLFSTHPSLHSFLALQNSIGGFFASISVDQFGGESSPSSLWHTRTSAFTVHVQFDGKRRLAECALSISLSTYPRFSRHQPSLYPDRPWSTPF